LAERDLIPESIVHKSQRFLVSSVRKSKIITADGKIFAKTEWPAYALAIDVPRRLLWASMGTGEGESALLAFDLASGELRRRVTQLSKGVLGDMTIASSGDMFVSGGGVFRLPAGANTLERLDQPGEFPSPQTPALPSPRQIHRDSERHPPRPHHGVLARPQTPAHPRSQLARARRTNARHLRGGRFLLPGEYRLGHVQKA
jgi:hypothetical protein